MVPCSFSHPTDRPTISPSCRFGLTGRPRALSAIQIRRLWPNDLCMRLLTVLSCCAYSSVELRRLSSLTSSLESLCASDLLWSIRDEPAVRA